jgi:hypothetical protein
VLLGSLIVVVFAVAALAVMQDNWIHALPPTLQRLKLLDTNNALTLLVALLTLVAMRQQYLSTLKPYLTYSSHRVPASESGNAEDVWRVEVYNVGTGVAIIQQTVFRYVSASGAESELDHDAVDDRLRGLSWEEGRMFSLPRFSTGFVLGPENKVTAFETNYALLSDLRALDLEITFASRSGERYRKDVFLIPRPSSAVAAAERASTGSQPSAASDTVLSAVQEQERG